MHNKIDNIDGWQICQVNGLGADLDGMWFAGRPRGREWCNVRSDYFENHDYIHSDGVARSSTRNGDKYSGYFEDKETLIMEHSRFSSIQ